MGAPVFGLIKQETEFQVHLDMFGAIPLDLSADEELEFMDAFAEYIEAEPDLLGPALSFEFSSRGVKISVTTTVVTEMESIAWAITASALTHAFVEFVDPDALYTDFIYCHTTEQPHDCAWCD